MAIVHPVFHDFTSRSFVGESMGLTYPQGLEAVERYFTVAKRIALYLARTSSQQSIDHLVYEISQQINEDEDTSAAATPETGVSAAQDHATPEPDSFPRLMSVFFCANVELPGVLSCAIFDAAM